MSAPAFGWALERGVALGLSPAERLVLIYLADMANGEMVCWPGQPTIVRYTGLALRTVISTLKKLEAKQLMRAEVSPGKVTRYCILRASTPANGAGAAPAKRAVVTRAKRAVAPLQNVQGHPCKSDIRPLDDLHLTPANGAGDPSKTQEEDPKPARASRASPPPLPHGRSGAALPPQPNGTPPPQPGITTEGGGAGVDRPPDPFADGGASKDWMSRQLGRPVHLAGPAPERITEDDVPRTPEDRVRMAEQLAGLAQSLAHRWQNNYPPRASPLDAQEQAAAVLGPPRVKAYFLSGEALTAFRRAALAPRAGAAAP